MFLSFFLLLTTPILIRSASSIESQCRDAAARLMTLQRRIDALESRFDAIADSIRTETEIPLGQTRFGGTYRLAETTIVWDQSVGGKEFVVRKGMKLESFNTPVYLGDGTVMIQHHLRPDYQVIRWMNESTMVHVDQRPIRKRSE